MNELFLFQLPGWSGYDEYDGFVVSAPCDAEARRIVERKLEHMSNKLEAFEMTKLGETDYETGIVLDSFNAG